MYARVARRASVVLALLAGCGGPSSYTRGYPAPTVASILRELDARRARAQSFKHAGHMEFWSDGDRVKTGVYVMGARGSKVRLQALDPAGGMVVADLACDGDAFTFVDHQKDCALTGPCDVDSIGALLRVRLTPDDLVLLALGQAPPLAGEAKGAVRWDAARGAEVVTLATADGRRQELVLDGRGGPTWDVVEARAWTADGKLDWTLEQKDFTTLKAPDGGALRVGRKLRFRQPDTTKGDLAIDWDEEQTLNPALDAPKFRLAPPAGLPICPSKPAPAPSPSPT